MAQLPRDKPRMSQTLRLGVCLFPNLVLSANLFANGCNQDTTLTIHENSNAHIHAIFMTQVSSTLPIKVAALST